MENVRLNKEKNEIEFLMNGNWIGFPITNENNHLIKDLVREIKLEELGL